MNLSSASSLLSVSVLLAPVPLSRQGSDLNDWFALDKVRLEAAYHRGRDLFKNKQKLDGFLGPYIRQIGTVRSPNRIHPWTPPKILFAPPEVIAVSRGYEDARQYNDDSSWEKTLSDNLAAMPADRQIHFVADLFAWPGVNSWDVHVPAQIER